MQTKFLSISLLEIIVLICYSKPWLILMISYVNFSTKPELLVIVSTRMYSGDLIMFTIKQNHTCLVSSDQLHLFIKV